MTENEKQAGKPVYGRNPVAELLKSGTAVDSVLLAESMDEKAAGYFAALAKKAGAVVKNTRTEKLNILCNTTAHQGVAAFVAEIQYYSLDELLEKALAAGEPPFLLLADGVEDPHNLGALIRTAFLCGAHGVVIPRRGAAPVTPVVMKASAGAAAHLPVARVANIGEAVRRLKSRNLFVYCADMAGQPPFTQNLRGAIALVVGAEGTVIEMMDKIAGQTDDEIAKILQGSYEKKGVEFKLGCKVVEIKKDAVVYEKDGKQESVKADKILMSIGRRAVTQGIGLENIGVELERGAIKTDRFSKTNIPNVYAAGDVNGKSMLAHTAYREAEVAVNNMLGKKDIMRYSAIPAVIYTNPEVGSVGETEQTAKEKGYDVQVASITMNYSGRYVAENEGGNGICKVIVDKKYNRLIGAHMIGSYASEIIVSAGIMIEMEMRIEDIKELVFPHPTVCEILREAIFQL